MDFDNGRHSHAKNPKAPIEDAEEEGVEKEQDSGNNESNDNE